MIFLLTTISFMPNMNGDVYGISNPNYSDPIKFSTQFYKINSNYEHFDVYSPPITSQYAMVYWTMMDPVPLPSNIVNKFKNKKIAITGYEVDQVFKFSNGSESSVPITWAYNHHYEAYLRNSENYFQKLGVNYSNPLDIGQYNHGAHKLFDLNNSSLESSLFNDNALYFSEGNGGEFRASFHGYPNGYAQLLNSPSFFNIQPMQIDTRNRDPKYINDTRFHASIMPLNSAAPYNASYSGLLECPCTTRIHKKIQHFYNNLVNGSCKTPILNISECFNVSRKRGNIKGFYNSTIHEHNSPYGCFFNSSGSYVNLIGGSCDNSFDNYFWVNDTTTNLKFFMNNNKNTTHMLFFGPASVWYGIGFNATSMKNEPYSIIVDGNGHVSERKLGNHNGGVEISTNINVLYNTVINNTRYISFSVQNMTNYNFTNQFNDINVILAVGQSPNFSYHRLKSSNILLVKSKDGNTCLCDDGKIGSINNIRFEKNCRPEPYGDLIEQHNPSCFIETYQGGQSCCHHKWVLLDENQTQPEGDMTYHLKFRFYFQEYTNQRRMVRAYYQTEAYSGEYDVPKCKKGTPSEECIHSITARWQVKDMVDKRYIGNSKGFELIYAAPHCHAPMCIDVELYNADTGDLLCHVDGLLGKGNLSNKYDELDYLKLNPCLWGQDRGLLKPQFLRWDTNLTSLKRCNSTNKHYGEMASWQMRGVVVN